MRQKLQVFMVFFALLSMQAAANDQTPFTLSIEELLRRAALQSDEATLRRTSLSALAVPSTQEQAKYDPKFYSKLSHSKDRLERSTTFQGGQNKDLSGTVGVTKSFASGSSITAEWGVGQKQVAQTSIGQTPHGGGDITFHQGDVSLSIRQQLLNNGFGRADKLTLRAIQEDEAALKLRARNRLVEYFAVLVDRYFDAWIAIENVKLATLRFERERRRKLLYDKQFKRGFIQQSDILQLEASLLGAKNNLEDAKAQVTDILIFLATVLNDGRLWSQSGATNARQNIQLTLGAGSSVAKLCQSSTLSENYQLNAFKHDVRAADYRLRAIEQLTKPSVYLKAIAQSNGIDEKLPPSQVETFRGVHPRLTFELGLEWIIGDRKQQSAKLRQLQQRSEAQIEQHQERAEALSQVRLQCQRLKSLGLKEGNLFQKIRSEKKRLELLDLDFQVGKTDINTLLQAEEALTQSKYAVILLRAESQRRSWQIKRAFSGLAEYVELALKG